MLLRFFGLNEDPFGVTPEPRFLFYSHTHREALASLKYGLQANRGFTAMIAAPGLGKTTLLYRFLNDIRPSARSVFLFDIDGECSPRELIASILRDLGIPPAATPAGMHDQLNKVLVDEARAGRNVVIVIDEAQNLSQAALETVRLLSNFETPRSKLLHIVLAGQLQLLDKLTDPSLIQLRQRITTFCRIDPLSAEETRKYIHHRLTMAGYRGEALFSGEAVELIFAASRGIPRTINNLCFNSLSICRALNQSQVTGSMVEEALGDLHIVVRPKPDSLVPSSPSLPLATPDRAPGVPRRRTIAAAVALCASALAVIGAWQIRGHQPDGPSNTVEASSRTAPATAPRPDETQSSQLQPASVQGTVSPPSTPDATKPQPFKVRVAPNQTLQDIAVHYLGEFNQKRWRQIRSLNPSLRNPNRVIAGQSIWLPGPAPANPGPI
jgi:general secretion pathway protein A